MSERIKTLLTELYPAANPSEGVDFDKSGTVEKGEAVKDFDGNGTIDDVDYGILTFNNRNAFIHHNGLNRWREVEKYWDEAAKKTAPVAAKNEPAISANNNAGNEALQTRIVNDEFGGEARLNKRDAQGVAETAEVMKEIHRRYPAMSIDGIRPSEAKRILAMMKEMEGFNPKLAGAIERMVYNTDECGYSALENASLGGCVGEGMVGMNPVLKNTPLEKKIIVHEAIHVYHETVSHDDQYKLDTAYSNLTRHVKEKYYIDRGAEERGREVLHEATEGIRGKARDTIERNIRQREAGNLYNKELLRLYEQWVSAREGSFNYQWNHVNQKYMPDARYEEVEAAGKELEDAQKNFEALTFEAFGGEGKSPFWHDSFFEGGDRQRPVVGGRVEELIDRCPDANMKKRLECKMDELDKAAREYRNALSHRQSSQTVSLSWPSDFSVVWKGRAAISLAGQAEGLAAAYGATDNNEAVATFVEYVYVNGKLPYLSYNARHNEMVKNYARLLRDHGFIRKDHPAVASL